MDRTGAAAWLLNALAAGFTVIHVPNSGRPPVMADATHLVIGQDVHDSQGLLLQRLDAQPGSTYVVRPDQHLCARFRSYNPVKVAAAIDRACART
jgi:3-(3-hydroxy-phenyl)propionate hydroxylase